MATQSAEIEAHAATITENDVEVRNEDTGRTVHVESGGNQDAFCKEMTPPILDSNCHCAGTTLQQTSYEPRKYPSRGRGGKWDRKGQHRDEQLVVKEIPVELIPANAVDITFKQTGKLWKVLLHPGDENVTFLLRRGILAKIHYKCWFLTDPDKKVFDSSSLYSEDHEPVCLNVGERQVILAIDDGVKSMTKKGEKALFIAHYDYGYGRKSSRFYESSNIPDESFLCVEVELVDVEAAAKLTGIYGQNVTREILHVAKNDDQEKYVMQPSLTTNSLMFVRLVGYKMTGDEDEMQQIFQPELVLPFTPCFNTWGFYTSGLTQHRIPYSLGPLLKCLRTGDKVLFTLSGECTFDSGFEANEVSVSPWEPVKYRVEVEEVEEMYDPFLISLQEKGKICEELINRGVFYFDHHWYEAAACKFTRVREYLSEAKLYLKVIPSELGNLCDNQLYFALCKLAELFWKLPEMPEKEALQYCNEAINLLENITTNQGSNESKIYRNGNGVDAYYLRGRLYGEVLKECGLAKQDFEKVLQLTEQSISQLQNKFEQMTLTVEAETSDNADAQKQPCENEMAKQKILEKMKDLNTKVKVQFKQVQAMAGAQAKQNCIFKWMPPK